MNFKVLSEDGKSCHGGEYKWSLPQGKKPGAWTPKRCRAVACQTGWHYCQDEQVLEWLGPRLFEIEDKSAPIKDDSKVVSVGPVRLVREFKTWNERTARLFACDCAERALKRERKVGREPDKRSWNAIAVARDFANGKASKDELAAASDAAWDTARAAVRAAASDAASDAARAAAWAAAWAAARVAARAAAWAAAWAAARDAERKWQYHWLMKYLNGEVR